MLGGLCPGAALARGATKYERTSRRARAGSVGVMGASKQCTGPVALASPEGVKTGGVSVQSREAVPASHRGRFVVVGKVARGIPVFKQAEFGVGYRHGVQQALVNGPANEGLQRAFRA